MFIVKNKYSFNLLNNLLFLIGLFLFFIQSVSAALQYSVYDDFNGTSLDLNKWIPDKKEALSTLNGNLIISNNTNTCTVWSYTWPNSTLSQEGCAAGLRFINSFSTPFGIKTGFSINQIGSNIDVQKAFYQGGIDFLFIDNNGARWKFNYTLGRNDYGYNIAIDMYQENTSYRPIDWKDRSMPISSSEFYNIKNISFEIDKDINGKLIFKGYLNDSPVTFNDSFNSALDKNLPNFKTQNLYVDWIQLVSDFWLDLPATTKLQDISALVNIDKVELGKPINTCIYNLNSNSANHSANAENGSFNVTVTNGCNWSASSNQSWVKITNPSGSGNATISYSIDANPNTAARSAIISVNGQTFTINQAAKTITQNPSIEVSSTNLTFSQQASTIDVMVLYTPTAASESANIIGEIQAVIEQTNAAYRNSGINQRLNLVHAAQINYQEADDMGVDLNRLTATNDGFLDEIHNWRDLYHADLVSLWRKNGNYCGIAWLLTENSTAFQSLGFSVVTRDCAVNNFTFAHELGHNMGANHDRYVTQNDGLHNYSHGYTYLHPADPSQSWRTIMAYVNECSNVQQTYCSRIPYFSNPNIFYQNIPTGNLLANNAATLNESSTIVNSFRGGSQTTKETQLLTISNKGSANLNVSNITINSNSPWLLITPIFLSITPNSSTQVQLTVDYSLMPLGLNSANITIHSNDPAKSALQVTVNAQATGQMDTMTVDSSKSNIFNALKQELKLDVNVPNATRRSGIDSFRVSLKPVTLPEKPSSLVFELGDVQLLSGNVVGKNASYNAYSNTVDIPAVNVPDQKGMPQLFRAKLQWLSQHTNKSLFEVVDAGIIPLIAIE